MRGVGHQGRAQVVDQVLAHVQVDPEADDGKGQSIQVVIGSGQPQVPAQDLGQRLVIGTQVHLDMGLPGAGRLDHFAQMQPGAQARQLSLFEGFGEAAIDGQQRLVQVQRRVGKCGDVVAGIAGDLGEGGAVQPLLVAEIVGYGAHVGMGGLGNLARGRALVAFFGKQAQGTQQQAFTGLGTVAAPHAISRFAGEFGRCHRWDSTVKSNV